MASPFAARARRLSANDKLNIGVVGYGGKGASDADCCSTENIIALCDVDENIGGHVRKKYSKAKYYQDFRQMLDKEKSLDAVIVATPDHNHALVAMTAMHHGKHIYCQKPLTQTVYEAREMRALARKMKVVTQMGNQGSAEDGLRRAVEVVQAGVIGPVREVYVWTNRPIWPQGMPRPEGEDPVPQGMDWNEWIGPAPMRPFKNHAYHPFVWRGWQDFGTGALGDMACHTANMPFRALKLGYPNRVEATHSAMNKDSYPLKSTIQFKFPEREGLAAASLWWFDGGNPKPNNPYEHDGSNKPPKEVTADVEQLLDGVPGSGCILIGDKGKIFSPDDYGARFFLKLNTDKEFVNGPSHDAVKAVPQTIPRNTFQGGADERHHQEWIAACKGGPPGYSNFDIAAYLTEIILLGCVALKTGKPLDWDGPRMRATNAPEAEQYIRRHNRKGFNV